MDRADCARWPSCQYAHDQHPARPNRMQVVRMHLYHPLMGRATGHRHEQTPGLTSSGADSSFRRWESCVSFCCLYSQRPRTRLVPNMTCHSDCSSLRASVLVVSVETTFCKQSLPLLATIPRQNLARRLLHRPRRGGGMGGWDSLRRVRRRSRRLRVHAHILRKLIVSLPLLVLAASLTIWTV